MDTTGGQPFGKRNRMTFLRQNYLDQVPGVETHDSLLSADLYQLPQPTTAFCTGFLGGKYHGGKELVNHCSGMSWVNPLYRIDPPWIPMGNLCKSQYVVSGEDSEIPWDINNSLPVDRKNYRRGL